MSLSLMFKDNLLHQVYLYLKTQRKATTDEIHGYLYICLVQLSRSKYKIGSRNARACRNDPGKLTAKLISSVHQTSKKMSFP